VNRSVIIICLTMLLVIGCLLNAFSQDEMQLVDNSDFENPQRPAALFAHDEHNEMAAIEDCAECHHLYEDGQLVEDESSEDQYCADCHGLKPEGSVPSLLQAFHVNCKGCHLERDAGPIMCGECHVRNITISRQGFLKNHQLIVNTKIKCYKEGRR